MCAGSTGHLGGEEGRAGRGGEGKAENNHNRRHVFIENLAFPQDMIQL